MGTAVGVIVTAVSRTNTQTTDQHRGMFISRLSLDVGIGLINIEKKKKDYYLHY